MTEDEIAKAINPQKPDVYGVTTEPTTLYYKNGDVSSPYFWTNSD